MKNKQLGSLFLVSVIDILGFGILIPLVPYMADRYGAPPAVINAVVDALKDYGVRHLDMPATGGKIWSIIHAAKPRMAAE